MRAFWRYYVSINFFKEDVDLLKKTKRTMFLSNILILLCMIIPYIVKEIHHFYLSCLQAFNTEVLKCHGNDWFKINLKKMPKNGEHVRFKTYGRKMKSWFMIYADSEIFQCKKIMEIKILKKLIRTNIM